MSRVAQVQPKDSMGQAGQVFQMAKTAFDVYKGADSGGGSGSPKAGEPTSDYETPTPAQTPAVDLSAGQENQPKSDMGAINRRVKGYA